MATNKKRFIVITSFLLIALAGIITFRIYANLAANKERAGRVSQGRVVEVESVTVGRRDLSPVITLSANLEAVWSAEISSKADGRIDRLYVDEGDRVQSGMIVADMDTNELAAQVTQAEGNLLVAKAGLVQAELDLKRTEPLASQGAVSAQALDAARIKRDLAIGQVRAAEGNLNLLVVRLNNANIIAPRDGIVVKRHLQAGYFAKAGAAIVSVADTSSLLAKATLGEGQITQMSLGAKAKVKVNALEGKEFSGTITRISPAAALPARTFTAEISIPNPAGLLKPGMFATAEIAGDVKKGVLVVPESALVMREDQKTVYVINQENKVRQQVLQLGYVGGGWAEVLDGIQEGDRIVSAGQNKIKDGFVIKVAGNKDGGK